MKRILFLLFSAVALTVYLRLFSPFEINQENFSTVTYTQNERIFFDDFTTNRLNSKWNVFDNTKKSGRIGTLSADDVTIFNNQLKLTTSFKEDGEVTSGYINVNTDDNGNNFNYGYYEARIRFTNNNNLEAKTDELYPGILKPWGAFWLYPTIHNSSYATEVDIVENQISGSASASIHPMLNQEVLDDSKLNSSFKNQVLTNDSTNFHTYGVAILPNETVDAATYEVYVDNQLIATYVSDIPLSHQTLHLTMEIATPDYQELLQLDPKISNQFENESMFVDYVAVYSID